MKHYWLYFLFSMSILPLLAQDEMIVPGCALAHTTQEQRSKGLYSEHEIVHGLSFPGGERLMYSFLRQNMRFPEKAKLAGILKTEIIISFVVETDGSLSDFQICRDIGYGCGDEAVRIAKLMPKWFPGEANGHPCRVWKNLKITMYP